MRDVDPFSSIGKPVRDVEPICSFEKPLSKGERNRQLESVQVSHMEKERILSEQKNLPEFLEKNADQAFRGEFAAQTRLSEGDADLDRRQWERRNADIALCETGMQLQSQWMELCQANQLTDQTRREKSWQCDELEMIIRAFQKDGAINCKEIEELLRICCTETERARQLMSDELSTQKEESKSTLNQLLAQIQDLQHMLNSLNDVKEFHDPEIARSSGSSHFPSQLLSVPSLRGMLSPESQRNDYPRFLLAA